jgi:hypothetical protein
VIARRGSTAPFGNPVVPDVYINSAGAPSATSAHPVGAPAAGTATRGRSTSGHEGSPTTSDAPESRRM